MKRILSLLVTLSFIWVGFSVYQLFGSSIHFGTAFWTTCLSLSLALILTTTRISLIEKMKMNALVAVFAATLILYSIIAWWNPNILVNSWNYFVGLFVLFIAFSLNELYSEKKSLILNFFFWIPWIYLSLGIILKLSSPLFFTSSLILLMGVVILSLFTVSRKRTA